MCGTAQTYASDVRAELLVIALVVVAVSLSLAAPAIAEDDPICWAPPALALKRDAKQKLSGVMAEAARASRPTHATRQVLELATAASVKTAALECVAVMTTELVIDKKGGWKLTLRTKDGEARELGSSVITVDPKSYFASDFTPAWAAFWRATDPPKAPEPPKVAAQAQPEPLIDADLAVEKAREAPRAVVAAPPRVRVLIATGLNLRTLSPSPGLEVGDAAVLSIGGEAALRIGSWIGEPHALDLTAGYVRRLARVVLDDEKLSVDADRFALEAAYRYTLGGGFAAGPLVGWEMLRFEIDPKADALSVRYGVIRAGLGVRQTIVEGGVGFDIAAAGALRIPTGSSVDLGFDLSVGPELVFDQRFLARATVRWARQSGDLGTEFQDSNVDLEIGVGVML